jgi:hypothetical protein
MAQAEERRGSKISVPEREKKRASRHASENAKIRIREKREND